ncbi:MAG: hypothetical protein A2365_02385 [Candidatus Nealsonbacteria bacterium RIFOXYB1_FULL_40_15]|uniref:PEP-utilising enzyme mobile domain-containing protein n=2 Tax=Candidatus Nealsoniibacteriota TaxID=1817911 RepID=A0A1G2EPG8_9BACT|nr:MAG: hypothetical protein A2365_02385 [Candidatus Nealsonbacteria bacterium RIFOXYB1_FULL_40_15]OGZ27637.1 MAG: hypothetical protein A2427_02710 [Candidatus Nealsonbacteria bacterium RIFOXYC1_FULL_40_7]OGZ28682.1 MAG: hypothetical protein A2562_00520 [Candidatus Nealsonbacteria bacterium RIFOXYD1_FULL_39_11]
MAENIIKGIAINKGTVEGEVVLVDFETMNILDAEQLKDKIVVTKSVSSNITPIVKKVKGIVTDEGGILSHAAKIAREFNIIAIVGTKNATQILKTGDYVELNGETGEIHILESRATSVDK